MGLVVEKKLLLFEDDIKRAINLHKIYKDIVEAEDFNMFVSDLLEFAEKNEEDLKKFLTKKYA